jgi:hypothetical protein
MVIVMAMEVAADVTSTIRCGRPIFILEDGTPVGELY